MVCTTNFVVFDAIVTKVNDNDSKTNFRQALLDKGE